MDDDSDEEQLESVVFERDEATESLMPAVIAGRSVWMAESVSLSTVCCDLVRLSSQVLTSGLFGLTDGGVEADLCCLSWLVMRS